MAISLRAIDGRRSLNQFDAAKLRAELQIAGGEFRIRFDDLSSWEWLEFAGSLAELAAEVSRALERTDEGACDHHETM